MKDQKSQEINEKREKTKGKRGHMALRNNVQDLKLDLWHELNPLEYYLVDIIIDKTIKWRTKDARIDPSEWLQRTRQKKQNLYAALKKLKEKKIITYRRDKHYSYYGLNEEYFGGLLIARHEKAYQERKSKIKLAVNNEKSSHVTHDSKSCPTLPPVMGDMTSSHATHDSNVSQVDEIIEEKSPLKTFFKDNSLKTSSQSGDGEQKPAFLKVLEEKRKQEEEARKKRDWTKDRTPEEIREQAKKEAARQLAAFKALEVS